MATVPEDLLTVSAQPARADGLVVVRAEGELDMHSRPLLEAAIPADCRSIAIDLRALTFLDSAGVHLLIELRRRVTTGGGSLLLVYAATGRVERVLDILGLLDTFPRHEDIPAEL